MTGMFFAFALASAGMIASLSIARMISALAPLAIRPSMSASCFSGEPPASALT